MNKTRLHRQEEKDAFHFLPQPDAAFTPVWCLVHLLPGTCANRGASTLETGDVPTDLTAFSFHLWETPKWLYWKPGPLEISPGVAVERRERSVWPPIRARTTCTGSAAVSNHGKSSNLFAGQ